MGLASLPEVQVIEKHGAQMNSQLHLFKPNARKVSAICAVLKILPLVKQMLDICVKKDVTEQQLLSIKIKIILMFALIVQIIDKIFMDSVKINSTLMLLN